MFGSMPLPLPTTTVPSMLCRAVQAQQALGNYEAAIRDLEAAGNLDESYPGLGELLREAKLALKKSKRVDYYKVGGGVGAGGLAMRWYC